MMKCPKCGSQNIGAESAVDYNGKRITPNYYSCFDCKKHGKRITPNYYSCFDCHASWSKKHALNKFLIYGTMILIILYLFLSGCCKSMTYYRYTHPEVDVKLKKGEVVIDTFTQEGTYGDLKTWIIDRRCE